MTADEPQFHESLLTSGSARTRISQEGGEHSIEIQSLYDFLYKTAGRPMKKTSYARFLTIPELLNKHFNSLHDLIGRGKPAEHIREFLLQCLDFLRNNEIIEFLPVLTIQNDSLQCTDYIICQGNDSPGFSVQTFIDGAREDSSAMVIQWLEKEYQSPDPKIQDYINQKDPIFIQCFPYYRLYAAFQSNWHSPADTSHTYFANFMKIKQAEFLNKIYYSLIENKKLTHHIRSDAVKKSVKRFPFAWPTSDKTLEQLSSYHELLCTILIRDLLMSDRANFPIKPDPEFPLYHANIDSEGFNEAYNAFLSQESRVPSIPLAYSMSLSILKHFRAIFFSDEKTLRKQRALFFARSVLIAIIMHSDTLIEYQKRREKNKINEAIESYISMIENSFSPYLDLGLLVQIDKDTIKTEEVRKSVIQEIRKRKEIRSIDVIRKSKFGSSQITVLSFHISRINEVFTEARNNFLKDKDFSLHIDLERIFFNAKNKKLLPSLIAPETYSEFLKTRNQYYVSGLSLLSRIVWRIFKFKKAANSVKVESFISKTVLKLDAKTQEFIRKEQLSEINAIKKEIVKEAIRKPVEDKSRRQSLPSKETMETIDVPGPSQSEFAGVPSSSYSERIHNEDSHDESSHNENAHDVNGIGILNPGFRARDIPAEIAALAEQDGAHSNPTKPDLALNHTANLSSVSIDPHESADAVDIGEAPEGNDEGNSNEDSETEGTDHQEIASEDESIGVEIGGEEKTDQEIRKDKNVSDPQESPDRDWESGVIRFGRKVGMDLSEEKRLERKREKQREKQKEDIKKKMLAVRKQKYGSKPIVRKNSTPEIIPQQVNEVQDKSLKHMTIIRIPAEHVVSNKPSSLQYKKKFFKNAKFRADLVKLYREEETSATTVREKQYYKFLIGTIEREFAKYL